MRWIRASEMVRCSRCRPTSPSRTAKRTICKTSSYDQCASLDADKLAAELEKAEREKISEYAFECHTQKGRRLCKTKAEFFRDEQAALEPFQPGLFDDLIEG